MGYYSSALWFSNPHRITKGKIMLKTAVDTNINLKVANIYKPLWKNAKRRNYIYGGRGSGKSHGV